MSSWDPIDSLIFLSKALPVDWVTEQLGHRFGYPDENEDVAELVGALDQAMQTIRAEVQRHHDGRAAYSTGVPFTRMYRMPATEPGEDGTDVPVIAEYWVSMRPDGHPREPYENGGVWADEPRPGEKGRP